MCGVDAVDIGGDDVGLDLVGGDVGGGAAVVDRVDQVEQFPGAGAVAQVSEGHGRPDGGVGVLAAVLAHAGDVALDVAGLQRGLVEGRVQELDQAGVAAHQMGVQRIHGLTRALGLGGPDSTDQLWAMESIRHSGLVDDPSGVPSSK
jgi:hypothetical protein